MSLQRRSFNRLVVQALAVSTSALVGAGCADPSTLPARSASRPASRNGARGDAKSGLVILAQFPDVPHAVPRGWAQRRFLQELTDYVSEMSYGRVRLEATITEEWKTLPRPGAQYAISPRNLEVDKSRVRRLVDDAVNAVEALTWPASAPARVEVSLRFRDRGELDGSGTALLTAPLPTIAWAAELGLQLNAVDLSPLAPYIPGAGDEGGP